MPAATQTARIADLQTDTKVRVLGTEGSLVGSRIIERGKNKGLREVILYGLHLGNRRNHSKTFFMAPDATCEVVA